MYKYVIFDFDGTIVDSSHVFINIGNSLAEKYGVNKITVEDFKALGKLNVRDKCKKLGIPLYKVPKIAIEILEKFYHHADELHLVEGIRDTIIKLKEYGYQLGIISSNSSPNIEKFLKSVDMNFFDCIQCAPGIFGKHHAINKFLKNMNLYKEHVIYIGDELRDIVSCKKSRVKVIAVTWGYDSVELLSTGNPDFLANNPHEIIGFVQGA